MKVITNEENKVTFDNGLCIYGDHSSDCCENNYLDFEQLPIGTELPTYNANELMNHITLKKDGFIVKDSQGMPKWVQARSEQNGYYSDGVDMVIDDGEILIRPRKSGQNSYGELFEGVE